MDLVPQFNDLLRGRSSRTLQVYRFRVEDAEAFLQEAYKINKHISELTSHLRSIRQSYLSAQPAPRRKQVARTNNSISKTNQDGDRRYLTDGQRAEIDADAKQRLRELNAAVSRLLEAEQARQKTESAVAAKKRSRQGFGGLGRWAAGGAITAKSPQEIEEDEKVKTIKMHRESIIWYLQRKLESCGRFQGEMMEIRITREVEKSKSALYKARGALMTAEDFSAMTGHDITGSGTNGSDAYSASKAAMEDYERQSEQQEVEQQLSPEQLQIFARENQDMLKHYEDTLDQVRTAERSLMEISELQTTLVSNLSMQQEHIDLLVQDSDLTEENVGRGNQELKKASEKTSVARMIFYSTSVFCFSLVVWDLLI